METHGQQISHPSELNSLLTPRPFRTPGRGTIRLSSDLTHPEKEQWEADLNRHYYACGCASSAQGLLIMLALGIGTSFVAYGLDAISLKLVVTLPIAAALAGALVGKFFGMAVGHRQLTRVVHTVQAHWKPVVTAEGAVIACG